MVSNSLSRRRHVIKAPAICISKRPPPPTFPPYDVCACNLSATWDPAIRRLVVIYLVSNPHRPWGETYTAHIQSEPQLAWENPYSGTNGTIPGTAPVTVPAAITAVFTAAAFVFPDGTTCQANATFDIPPPPIP
jgi:hypothetical protein